MTPPADSLRLVLDTDPFTSAVSEAIVAIEDYHGPLELKKRAASRLLDLVEDIQFGPALRIGNETICSLHAPSAFLDLVVALKADDLMPDFPALTKGD